MHRKLQHSASRLRNRERHQSGSILVQFALLIGVLVAILGIVDIGYMYYVKRDLQRVADQAAMDAVQGLQFGENPGSANCSAVGKASIESNWPLSVIRDDTATKVDCGNWNPATHPAPPHFSTRGELNAAHVVVQGTSPTLLPGPWNRSITAEAVAKREAPLASFSIGTTLVGIGCRQELAPLVQLLKVVGVGDPCVTVGGYEGLVGAQISASGLLKALGLPLDANLSILDVNNLLAAEKVSLGRILDLALTLGGKSELLDLNAKLLELLRLQLGIDALNLEVPLGSGPNGPGIFASIHAPDGASASALDVQLNVLDIVTAAIGVGTSGRGVYIPGLSITIPGILPNLLRVKAGIIEPPSIAIGGVGATAYNAQVRLYTSIDTGGGLLGGLLELLGTRIKLPIFIDVARAKGTIEELTCRVPARESSAHIRVDASIAQACIGKTSGDPFSTRTPVCESLEKETLVSVLGLIKIHNTIKVDALEDSYDSKDEFPEGMKVGDLWRTPGNQLHLGTTLSNLVNELLRLVGELLGSPTNGDWTAAENKEAASKMADYYLGLGSPTHPQGAIPKDKSLGFRGPSGAYDIPRLRDRLKKEIDRTTESCFILPFLCWTNNEWDRWANDIESANIASKRACYGETREGFITAGEAGKDIDVDRFNRCVERELEEAMFEAPDSKPNFLQVLLSPLLELLKAILNPLGNLLAGPILRDVLGIELGVNDVHLNSIGCGNAQLVY